MVKTQNILNPFSLLINKMPSPQQEDYFASFIAELNSRIADIEERYSIIRERLLLIGKNLIELKEKIEKEITEIKINQQNILEEQEKIKRALLRIEDEIDKRARKEELNLLEKHLKIFDPIKFARIEDVEKIIEEKLKK